MAKKSVKKCKPVPLPTNPSMQTNNASIVIPTIETGDTFPHCLELMAANKPLEIIIVTVPRYFDRVSQLVGETSPEVKRLVRILTADFASKREQNKVGILAAKGDAIALVDDDAMWNQPTVLSYLLACFEDPKVGACVGKIA